MTCFVYLYVYVRMSLLPHSKAEEDHDDSRLWIEFDTVHKGGIANRTMVFPQHDITGKVMLDLPTAERTPGLIATCFGRANIRFTLDTRGNPSTRSKELLKHKEGHAFGDEFFGHEVIMEKISCLLGYHLEVHKDMEVLPGRQTFNFRFQIPEDSPSTFIGDYGSIMYYVEVRLRRTNKTDILARKEFRVCGMLDLSGYPIAGLSQGIERAEHVGCKCSHRGRFGFKLKVNKSAFVPLDNLHIVVVLQNSTKKDIKFVRMRLIETTLFRAVGTTITTQHVLTEYIGPNIAARSSEIWCKDITLPGNLLPTNLGSSGCIIELDYMLELRMIADDLSRPVIGHLPIVVGTTTPDEYDEPPDQDMGSAFSRAHHHVDPEKAKRKRSNVSLHHTPSGLMKHRFRIKEEHLRYVIPADSKKSDKHPTRKT